MENRILSVEKKTDNRFLNMYDLHCENKVGKKGTYFLASRAKNIDALKLNTRVNKPDGVIIYSIYGEKHHRMVLVRQYRFTIAKIMPRLVHGS
jgi:ADP-ribose pyrophosphatase